MKPSVLLVCLLLATSPLQAKTPSHKSEPQHPHKVGVSLCGGGALGFAHLGALQALEENGIKPDMVSGASMGSIIGSLYCAGYSPKEILKLVEQHRLNRFSNLTSIRRDSHRGFFGWRTIRQLMRELIPHDHFDSLKTPLAVSVTNISKGQVEYMSHGPKLKEYVMASASLPGIFEALEIDSMIYVDGGILDNLPVQPLKDAGCDFVIGIDVMDYPTDKAVASPKEVVLQTVLLFNGENNRSHAGDCNWYIHFDTASKYDIMSFEAYREIYQLGYNATLEYLKHHAHELTPKH